jgi:LacI family transcriptional regulator
LSPATAARRKRSARFADIAAEAGVSPATVDRVLNERDSVSAAARDKVLAAARRLEVNRHLPTAHQALVRIDLMLPDNPTPFFRALRQALDMHIQLLDRRVVVQRHVLDPGDETGTVERILATRPPRHSLIITAPDTADMRHALGCAMARGESVVTLVTDVACKPAHAYVGINHTQAGYTAGTLLHKLIGRPGRVLLLGSRTDYAAHLARGQGCAQALQGSGLVLETAANTLDDPDRCYFSTLDALRACARDQAPLVGIYNTGAGSEGIAHALRRHGATPAAGSGRVVLIGHEASDEHRHLLQTGVMDFAIDQDAPGHALMALRHALYTQGLLEEAPLGPIQPRLYCAANLPPIKP